MSAVNPHCHAHGRQQCMIMLLHLIEPRMRPLAPSQDIISGNHYFLIQVDLESRTYIPP